MTRAKIIACYARPSIEEDLGSELALENEILAGFGEVSEITLRDGRAAFIAALGDADAVLTNHGVGFDAEVISRMTRCRVIAVAAVGVDTVDLQAATKRGLVVTNTPDTFIEEVADHTLMLLLASARRLGHIAGLAAQGQWARGRRLLMQLPRLMGQTLGLLGYGNAARAVVRRATPFGLRCIAHDPYVADTVLCADGVEPVALRELLATSDYLSLHTPLNEETHHLLNEAAFKRMKASAILINTARGAIVDEVALVQALDQGDIAGAALDVLATEPPHGGSPLLDNPDVILTPHVASASTRMLPACRQRAAREVALVLQGKWPMNCVNPEVLESTALTRWQPYSTTRGPNR